MEEVSPVDDELILALLFFGICYGICLKLPKPKKPVEPVTLGPGSYTAGDDIPEGKYDLTATEGSGDFCYREKDAEDWAFSNTIAADSPLKTDRFRNLDLKKGDTLEINCNVTVSAAPASAIKDVKTETLHPGIYRFGADVPPGKYTLEAVEGSGYAYTRNPEEKDKSKYEFFQFMAKDHQEKAPTFANVKCEEKHELWIMGSLQLKLVDVSKPKK